MSNKKMQRAILIAPIFALYVLPAMSEELDKPSGQMPSVLDASQHPLSPSLEGAIFDEVLPLEAELSWIERFNGDETWNASIGQKFLNPAGLEANVSVQAQKKTISATSSDAHGFIKSIRPEQSKIVIAHGPIDKYGMPAMSMVFKVEDPEMLEGIKKGQEIGFDVDNTDAGFVVTHIRVSGEPKTSVEKLFDAFGKVKSIRPEQSKIVIAHGPIDKYGMPAMSMVFKVEDPEMLEGIKKGQEIGFDVDNTDAGFVVTRIEAKE